LSRLPSDREPRSRSSILRKRKAEAGMKPAEVCRKHGISE